jgi:flavin-dependent dehydrogenase
MVTKGRLRWVLRLLPNVIPKPEEIKVPPAAMKSFLEAKNGLFLICGPTGSGKSTTIASMVLSRAKRRREHVISFEDPIEFVYPEDLPSLISQREMGNDEIDFGKALRAALRQAPDVILVGEIRDGETAEIALQAADTGHVVVATGAQPQGLVASGLCERQSPSAVGLRGYVRHPGLRDLGDKLQVVWHRRLKPGYGWIFPCTDGIYNIGVGIIDSRGSSARTVRDLNLRQVFDEFVKLHAPARELMAGGTFVSPLKGAPLRTSLKGARVAAPGILVTGEAAGSTYSFTGEGIGKAMETGLLAADALLAARKQGLSEPELAALYAEGLRALKPKFDLYEKGNRVNHHPWLGDLLIRRARKSQRLRNRMAAVLEERATPAQLITLRGLVKLFIE